MQAATSDFPIPDALRSLGNPLQICPPQAGAGRGGYLAIAAVLTLPAGGTTIGLVNPPAQNPPPPEIFVALTSLLVVGALLSFGMGQFGPRSRTLILFPDGLASTGGAAPEIFRWSDVREVYQYLHPIAWKHRIVMQDGRHLEISRTVKNGKHLGEAPQQALFDRMLPSAAGAFDRGETVTFGALRLDPNFLYYENKRLAWREVAKMSLLYNAYTRSLMFEVKAAGSVMLPWRAVRTQDIPNLNIFKTLAERKKAFAIAAQNNNFSPSCTCRAVACVPLTTPNSGLVIVVCGTSKVG